MTQGKIERYHRSLKNVVTLEHYYTPWEVERAVAHFVEHDNHRRYHEALQNVTPADVFFGRQAAILSRRARIKQRTLQQRKRENLQMPHHAAIRSEVSLRNGSQLSNLV
jgi:putative transposase